MTKNYEQLISDSDAKAVREIAKEQFGKRLCVDAPRAGGKRLIKLDSNNEAEQVAFKLAIAELL